MSVCLATFVALTAPRAGTANFLSLPLDLIPAIEFGLPDPEENSGPDGNGPFGWLKLPPPAGSGSGGAIGTTGHGVDFADWISGGGQSAGRAPFSRNGALGSGAGGWASQGVGAGPGVGDDFFTNFNAIPASAVVGSAGTGGSGSQGTAGGGGGAGTGGGGTGGGGGDGGGGGGGPPDVSTAPEPAGITLFSVGFLALGASRWRRKRILASRP